MAARKKAKTKKAAGKKPAALPLNKFVRGSIRLVKKGRKTVVQFARDLTK